MRFYHFLFVSVFCGISTGAMAQYYANSQNIYSSKSGNLIVTATSTSVNRSRPDTGIFLKSKNLAANTRDMLTWTNGSLREVREFIAELILGLDKPVGTTFQVNYKYTATVLDSNTVKVATMTGGYSLFKREEMYKLLVAINGKE